MSTTQLVLWIAPGALLVLAVTTVVAKFARSDRRFTDDGEAAGDGGLSGWLGGSDDSCHAGSASDGGGGGDGGGGD
ncbi:hypothetical protein [Aurantimonas sp. 22II-16-19i]|uniref:hypothetical protein n=1 Tax=Aurantimonas sp. 22II-16-19i TaxID=1317114 RepID=UPI0009F7F674|nr:hypothetical protein [Aurantimonas sp. 22II-16-19i]ORE89846.1 hypothetical protein ATO4_23417 [Aurantimonas sp. 22II-16-19i]